MRNENMEEWADRIRTRFTPPHYRVELKALESELWVVDEQTHHVVELDEEELMMHSADEVYSRIRDGLAN